MASFGLRVACLILRRPKVRRVLIMDEPFKFLSENYRSAVKEMLHNLSEKFQIQFIMVTHIDELKMGQIIEIGKE